MTEHKSTTHTTTLEHPAVPASPGALPFVHYVLSSGRNKGQHRPAAVVHDWGGGRLNLIVFTDASNDFDTNQMGFNGTLWATSVPHSDTHEPHSWHKIEQ